MRKSIVANWKMYLTLRQSVALVKRISNLKSQISRCKLVLCPSFVAMEEVAKVTKGTRIKLGAQDIFCCDARGAYTGEIGVDDLGELGVEYVLVGHSERRRYFNESDELVNQKLRAVLTAGMRPILCVGEPLEIRRVKQEHRYVGAQIRKGLHGVVKKDLKRVVIAYEPIWAIGTGHTDNPADAAEMHKYIRKVIIGMYRGSTSVTLTEVEPQRISILYGGSVQAKNAGDFLKEKEIDGLLIGKASANHTEFIKIINSAG